jgi:apolipoprotein N-acyltransferase
LQQKNVTRATAGAFVLVVCIILAANGFPVIGWPATAAIAALALLYLVVGVAGSQGSRFDVMSVFYWGALALGCGALLIFIEGIRL